MLRNRSFMAVSVAVCAAYIGIGLVGPVRILYAESLGASLAIISAMASAYLISNFAAQYPAGWLADRWGRRRLLAVGLVVQALVSLAYVFISDPVLFVALRFVEGLAGAAILPSARALVADAVAPEQRGEAYGLFGAFFNAGFLIGPALGGLLATSGYTSVFIAAVACRVVALAIVVVFVPRATQPVVTAQTVDAKARMRELFALPLVGAYVLAFGDYLYLGFDLALMPLWMHDHLGATTTLIGLAYVSWAAPSIILSPIGGRVADRTRRSWLILIFGLGQVPLYIVYGLASSVWLVIALFGVHALLYSFIQPAVDAHVAAASAETARARVQGMYSTVGLAGAFVGANTLTPLYALNFRLPLFALGAAYGLCVLIGGLLVRRSEARGLTPGAPQPNVAVAVE